MKYESKDALVGDIQTSHEALLKLLGDVPEARWHEPGVWGDGWNLTDLVAHLAEWQHMFLSWHENGLKGIRPEGLAPGYKWNEFRKLNRVIWEKHRNRSIAAVRAEFDSGHRRILQLAEGLSQAELLEAGHFAWTGKHPLVTYLGPNAASHYRFATKAIKRWLKKTATNS